MAKTTEEIDLSAYLEKEATDLQSRFAEWLMENVGYDPSKAKTKQEAFEEGVRLSKTGTRRLDEAERKLEILLERDRVEPFDPEAGGVIEG